MEKSFLNSTGHTDTDDTRPTVISNAAKRSGEVSHPNGTGRNAYHQASFSILKKLFEKIFYEDLHIFESRGIYIVEGYERPAEWKDAHHIFPRSNGHREWIYEEQKPMG